MSEEWKPGDLVRHTTGGPTMSVVQVLPATNLSGGVRCRWWRGCDEVFHVEMFYARELEPAERMHQQLADLLEGTPLAEMLKKHFASKDVG